MEKRKLDWDKDIFIALSDYFRLKRNYKVLIGGFILLVISFLLIRYSYLFFWIFVGLGTSIFLYYGLTLTPEQRNKWEKRNARKRHLANIREEARARKQGENDAMEEDNEESEEEDDNDERTHNYKHPLGKSHFSASDLSLRAPNFSARFPKSKKH